MSTPLPNPDSPSVKRIEAIKASSRCFVLSLLGLVPVLGIPFSVAAIIQGRKVEGATGKEWNPAGRYLAAAHRIAPLGFLVSAGFLLLVCVILPTALSDLCPSSSGHT